MITKLIIDKQLEQQYVSDSGDNSINNLNQLNILIGANNTGKSRFLRALFTNKEFKFEMSEFNVNEVLNLLNSLYAHIEIVLNNYNYTEVSGQNIPALKKDLKKQISQLETINLKNVNEIVNNLIKFWSWLIKFSASGGTINSNIISTRTPFERISRDINETVYSFEERLNKYIPLEFTYALERVYIPILRGLRPTQFKNDDKFDETIDNYLQRTIRDYFLDKSIKEEEIFTGLRLYNDTKQMLLGKQEGRDRIKNFELFLSKTFFNNEIVTLIPNISDDSVHVSIGNEERPIYELGDGIQSIIILLYPLFFNQGKKMLVFIEEPENFMHPGLQRLFLETITHDSFKSFQYFITTHSNHFLDLTLELSKISVYTFNRILLQDKSKSIYKIENTSNESSSILDLIGARNSSVFLSNSTIWVEGITDRLYIKKYLEIYQNYLYSNEGKQKFKEDFNFSFIEYGGNNITHWTFGDETAWEKIKANRISSKMFLIADRDSTDTKQNSEKAKRLKLLKQVLGDHFQIVSGREIENLLSPKILISTILMLEKTNSQNLIYDIKNITVPKYLNKPMGKFISSNFQKLGRKYEADSGTIFCKLEFCKAAIANMKNIDDLTDEAKELAKNIYNFVSASNPS